MSPLISPEYTEENRKLHERAGYGSSGHYWLGHVLELADIIGAKSVLDYGAGKATLGPYVQRYGLDYLPYDPATYPEVPKGKFDLVVCLDVLEHLEPEARFDVIEHIGQITGKLFLCVVNTRPSSKVLSDGRNAHLIQEDWSLWKRHLHKGVFRTVRIRQHAETFEFVGQARPPGGITPEQRSKIRGEPT